MKRDNTGWSKDRDRALARRGELGYIAWNSSRQGASSEGRNARKRAARENLRAFHAEAVRLGAAEGRRFPKFKRPQVALQVLAPEEV